MLTKQVAGRVYNYEFCIGRNAQVGNGFSYPMDFALGSNGSLYVVNRGTEFIPAQGITKCSLNHEIIWEDRGTGFAGGGYSWPTSVAVDKDETVYISDDYSGAILQYDKDGQILGKWGTKGSGDGELNGPSGLEFDKEDNLYIVDGLNNRVQKFTKDGKFLAKWGSQGTGQGQFDMPWGIAIDKAGDVYVADWKNSRVQKFSPDGKYLATFGAPGTGAGELSRPTGIAIDDEGDVYITDKDNNTLNIYASDGTYITSFIGDAENLSPWAQAVVDANPDYAKARMRVDKTPEFRFRRPISVNIDDQGRIMVLENQNNRIQIYVKEREFVDAPFNL